MKRPHLTHQTHRLVLAWAASGLIGIPAHEAAGTPARETSKLRQPEVEVVFVLDSTGSMGGLIEAAKQKIWSIANEIAKGRPTPKIRMGLIAYRDRGDAYVTQVFDLSENLDRMYTDLLALRADEGGDGPEHVLQALSDAVKRMSWSRNPEAFKVVYLVGDAPPHFDYTDTPPLEGLLQQALRRGLIVNAIQCGNDPSTTAVWQRIARLAEGQFLAVPQTGGAIVVSTPFDERIAALSERLGGTLLPFGERRREGLEALAWAEAALAMAPRFAAADRALFKSRAGYFGVSDLAEAVRRNEADLERLADPDLPEELRGLTLEQKQARLEAILRERAAIQQELDALSARRERYLAEERKRSTGEGDAFDLTLVESLKTQASRRGITY